MPFSCSVKKQILQNIRGCFGKRKTERNKGARAADERDRPGKLCRISVYAFREEDDGIYNEFPRVFVSS